MARLPLMKNGLLDLVADAVRERLREDKGGEKDFEWVGLMRMWADRLFDLSELGRFSEVDGTRWWTSGRL